MHSETFTARLVGALFIVATATAVAADLLLRPLRDDADFLTRFRADEDRAVLAVLSDLTLALAVIGIAVLLFPILQRTHVGAALGYVGVRILEAVIIVVGAISSLLLLTLGRDHVESGATSAGDHQATSEVLLQAREWTDTLGTAVVFGISALILYGLMYRSEIVPRWLSIWGFIGAVMIVVAGLMRMYGLDATSTTSVVLSLPIGLQEMVLAVWLIVRGFDPRSHHVA